MDNVRITHIDNCPVIDIGISILGLSIVLVYIDSTIIDMRICLSIDILTSI